MAFPMVLAGTSLVACFGAYFVFPYGWSFNLAMTFGAILSATDPVAVSALLNEVGAPPRLKVLISGESLLNDGSAIVFFTIFSERYLHELGVSGVGESIDWGRGIAIFFQMSLGGAAIGLTFGIGLLLILFLLNRRLNVEENVLQITATITVAYLTYYTAEMVAHTSGVIATVVCGVITKQFGGTMINDRKMMESFWVLVEHLLNTLLFTLGGVVWGGIIGNGDRRQSAFEAQDWGYLFLLYVLLMAIRYFLFFSFYPIISRIGLKSCWQEAIFMSFAGLRGAVGIALAIALDNEVLSATDSQEFRDQTTTLFGMVGGVTFFTLIINGSLSGPLLRKLGLTKSSEIREKILKDYCRHFREHILQAFIHKLTDSRFQHVEFGLIEHHVSFLRGLTIDEFEAAVEQNKDSVAPKIYQEPYTESVLHYLHCKSFYSVRRSTVKTEKKQVSYLRNDELELSRHPRTQGMVPEATADPSTLLELRTIFIQLLRAAYQKQIDKGELDGRAAFVDYVLLESLDFSADSVCQGEPINDFEVVLFLSGTWSDRGDRIAKRFMKFAKYFGVKCNAEKNQTLSRSDYIEHTLLRNNVHIALAFIDAHLEAQACFQEEFCRPPFEEAQKLVARESKDQVHAAMDFLESQDQDDVKIIVSHLLCTILLNKLARYVEHVTHLGFLEEKEASVYIEQIEEELEHLQDCTLVKHGDENMQRGKTVVLASFNENEEDVEDRSEVEPPKE